MKHLRKSILTLLALTLFGGAGAWAQTETLLTTITATAQEQASYSTANVATVSFSTTAGGSSNYYANWGWWGYGWIATVTAAEGYTITKCIFYDDANRTATDSEAPFVVETTEEDKTPKVNGTPILEYQSRGIKKIDVYGYVTPAEPAEIELTKVGANQWTLGQTPDYDLELQVEYYEAHALKDIPAGWTVLVNGVDKTAAIDHDSLMITETDSVTLIPDGNPRRVKSVTLEDEAPATPEYYNKLTQINDNYDDQVRELKLLGRGYQAYNSSLTAAQAYALATYQAAIDGQAVYVIMSSQDEGYEIHYAVSTDASATEHTADLYIICYPGSPAVRMYYVAQ